MEVERVLPDHKLGWGSASVRIKWLYLSEHNNDNIPIIPWIWWTGNYSKQMLLFFLSLCLFLQGHDDWALCTIIQWSNRPIGIADMKHATTN